MITQFTIFFCLFLFFAKTQKSKYEIKIMIEVNCAQLFCDAQIHFSGLSRRSPCGFRGLELISKTVHIPPFHKTITDHISGYVYAGIRGRVRGNSADEQPRLKHKGQLRDSLPTGMQQRLFFHV